MTTDATPTFFGPDARLFGWLHRPRVDIASNIGIVVCNPFGYEYVCTHRTVRAIAKAGAENGHAVLRFDYEGTGDSAGNDLALDRVSTWLGSIGQAIQYLKQATGVAHVVLLGVRLGAALAVLAAKDRSDIAAIIAYAPIINGRKYVRELRSLALASTTTETASAESHDADLQEAAGFATTAAVRAELTAIDLTQLTAPPAAHVLILHRDDLPADATWLRHLQSQQIDVQQAPLQGYIGMVSDAHENHVPQASIKATIDWLASRKLAAVGNTSQTHAAPTIAQTEFTVSRDGQPTRIRESLVFTDAARTQFGILSEPLSYSSGTKQLLILLSSGAVARPGPNGLYVAIARSCAASGIAVLRLDISGIGDSEPRDGEPPNIVYTSRAPQDIAQAIEFVTGHLSPNDIHAGGVCSGGFHSLKAAAARQRLRSIIVINPLTFYWEPGMTLTYPAFQVTAEAMRYRRNALQLSSWLKVLRGKADIAAAVKVVMRRVGAVTASTARNACRLLHINFTNDLGSELQGIASRNVDMLFVFAATDPGLAMLREQSGISLPRLIKRGKLRTTLIDGADHTFTPKRARDSLVAIVTSHLAAYAKADKPG